MAVTRSNELTRVKFEVTFLSDDLTPTAPSTARWRAYCATTNTDLTEWADISVPPNGRVEIELPASMTRIISNSNRTETRVLAVEANYGTEDQVSDEHEIIVKNLYKTG